MRFLAIAVFFFLVACGGASANWKLPAAIEGGWKLSVLPPNPETYEMVNRLGPKQSVMAGYEGPGKLRVAAFELANGAAAFEQVQKWRAQPGKIAFHHGAWLVVLESEGTDSAGLSAIATAIERTMPE